MHAAVPTRPRPKFKSWPPFLGKALRFVRGSVRDFFYPLTDFCKRIARICAWLPILWRDRDWDDGALVRIVEFKLRRMAKCIGESGIHVGNERNARDMRIAAEYLHRCVHPEKCEPPYPGELGDLFESVPGKKYRRIRKMTPAQKLHHQRCDQRENAYWNAAWEMIRKRGRTWWD